MADQEDKPYKQFIHTILRENPVSLYIKLNYLLFELEDVTITQSNNNYTGNAYTNQDDREKLIDLINKIIIHILDIFEIPEDLVGITQEEMNDKRGVYDLNKLNVQKPEGTEGDKTMINGGYLIKPKSKKKSKKKSKNKSKRKSKK